VGIKKLLVPYLELREGREKTCPSSSHLRRPFSRLLFLFPKFSGSFSCVFSGVADFAFLVPLDSTSSSPFFLLALAFFSSAAFSSATCRILSDDRCFDAEWEESRTGTGVLAVDLEASLPESSGSTCWTTDEEAPEDGPGVRATAREEGGGDLAPGMVVGATAREEGGGDLAPVRGDAPCDMPGVDAGDLPMEEVPCEAGTAACFCSLSDEESDFSNSTSDSSSCGTLTGWYGAGTPFLAAEGRR
jgi:hypothetical protein